MVSDRNRRIQDRAYEIWVEGGRQDGTSDRNWAQAEQEVGHHDRAAPPTHPEASQPAAKRAPDASPKTKTAKSAPASETKTAKSKAPKDKAAKDKPAKDTATKTAPEKDKSAKAKSGDPKPRSKK